MYNPLSILRALVYLKSISSSLIRIADSLDRAYPIPQRSRTPIQIGVASVTDWNQRYQEELDRGEHIPSGVDTMKGPTTY